MCVCVCVWGGLVACVSVCRCYSGPSLTHMPRVMTSLISTIVLHAVIGMSAGGDVVDDDGDNNDGGGDDDEDEDDDYDGDDVDDDDGDDGDYGDDDDDDGHFLLLS